LRIDHLSLLRAIAWQSHRTFHCDETCLWDCRVAPLLAMTSLFIPLCHCERYRGNPRGHSTVMRLAFGIATSLRSSQRQAFYTTLSLRAIAWQSQRTFHCDETCLWDCHVAPLLAMTSLFIPLVIASDSAAIPEDNSFL
jgi:hypothetical protein